LTTDKDNQFSDIIEHYNEEYNILDKVISIDHNEISKNPGFLSKRRIKIRPFGDKPYKYPIFNINVNSEKFDDGKKHFFIPGSCFYFDEGIDMTFFDLLKNQDNVFHILSRKKITNIHCDNTNYHSFHTTERRYDDLLTKKNVKISENLECHSMLEMITKCDYVLFLPGLNHRHVKKCISGFLILGMCCGSKILTNIQVCNSYKFKYSKNNQYDLFEIDYSDEYHKMSEDLIKS
jgi:hypothetical protein